MRSLVGFLFGTAVGAAVCWAAISATEVRTSPGKETRESFADQFLRAAQSLGQTKDALLQRKQELLKQAAANRQIHDVTASGPYWAEFKKSVASTDGNDAGQARVALLQLLAFQEQLEEALRDAPNIADFDHAWDTWTKVNQQIAETRKRLMKLLTAEFQNTVRETKEGSPETAVKEIERLGTFLRQHEADVAAILAATRPTEAIPAPIAAIGSEASQRRANVSSAVTTIASGVGEQRAKIHDGSLKLEPSKSPDKLPVSGWFTDRLAKLADLEQAVQDANLDRWLRLTEPSEKEPSDASGKSESPGAPADSSKAWLTTEQAALGGRQLAYNLWALREIYAAESVKSWPGRLAQIDQGMLEPVVAALYSTTYARRLADIKDPERRSSVVQTILVGPKIPSTAF